MRRHLVCIFIGILVFGGGWFADAGKEANARAIQFRDVPTSYTFYHEIMYLSEKGIISDFTDGAFRAEQAVTRAQAAIMIGKAQDLNGNARDTIFPDVPASVTGSGYIASAVEAGIISGFPDGTFRPYEPVTRGQMAIFLSRAFHLTAGQSHPFHDISPNMAAYQAIINISSNGIASGYPDGTYRPNQLVNRGQFSGFMARTLDPSFRKTSTPPPKLDIIGLTDDFVTNDRTHQLTVLTDNEASVTVTLNGKPVYSENNMYTIHCSKEGKNIIRVTSILDGVSAVKQIEGIYKVENSNLTISEITQLNDEKIVTVWIHSKNGGSQGSGVIVGNNGLILTNEHVVADMADGTVTLNDGTEYKIEGVVESDAVKDLALIKTTEKINITPVTLGSYSDLAKGEKIVAIGSPRGLQNTVSEGIVSSFREFDGVQHIQISVPIDHGSSGGGLFNLKGELVGITTWGVADNIADLNFAVAIDEVKNWEHYFTMPFADIKVKENVPPTGILPIPGLENIALGMTKEQVKQAETAQLFHEDSTALMYLNKWIFDFSAEISYHFENNRLVSIAIFHDILGEYNEMDLLEAYFYVMYDYLFYLYGYPVSLDTNWFDDYDGYGLSALWYANNHDIFLGVQIRMDYTSFGGILISIQ